MGWGPFGQQSPCSVLLRCLRGTIGVTSVVPPASSTEDRSASGKTLTHVLLAFALSYGRRLLVLRRTARLVLLTATASVLVAPAASAATASVDHAKTIVLFAENRGIARVDNNAAGPDNGDLVHRELALSRTRAGAVIGVAYSQSEIVAYNPEAKIDVRRVDIQDSLPGGQLFITGTSKLAIGSVPQPGWTDTYAVVGGTGKYAGARGTERLTLLEDGKTFKLVITLLG